MCNNYTKHIFVSTQQNDYSKIIAMSLKIMSPQNWKTLLIKRNASTIADFWKRIRTAIWEKGYKGTS